MTAPAPRAGLRDVAPYVSPQVESRAKLNTNECPVDLPAAFHEDLAAAIREIPLNRYPDGQMTELRNALAERHEHPVDGVWVANGSNEILTQILQAFGGHGRQAVMFEPTYLLHSRLCWLTETRPIQLTLKPPFTLGAHDVTAALSMHPNVIFVCSPNNPTGNPQPLVDIQHLVNAAPTALVVVDEAYIDFGGESAFPLLAEHPNLAVVRTFSKAFSMAGARLGYVLTSKEVVEDLQRVRLPYHVSALTQTAGVVALRHMDSALGLLEAIRNQRDRILAALTAIEGCTVFPSQANFVLFVPPKPAAEVWQGLLDRGVLVRDMTSVVPEALRVTAGTAQEIDLFLESLTDVLNTDRAPAPTSGENG
ncbi:MAG: histidinol-phosphate aminotransferase [Actinomycetota bacterium]|nr:histidinol-phosphate aminotransferase [Actinomycetota bacterium]